MIDGVVVLNGDYSYLNIVVVRDAITMIYLKKVEVIRESATRFFRNVDRTHEIPVPKVIRLINLVRSVYRNKVPYSPRNVFIRDNYTCQYCGTKGKMTVDHIIPKSQGGKHSFENCVAACIPCNVVKKRNRTPDEAGMYLICKPVQPTIMEFFLLRMKKIGVMEYLKELGVL